MKEEDKQERQTTPLAMQRMTNTVAIAFGEALQSFTKSTIFCSH